MADTAKRKLGRHRSTAAGHSCEQMACDIPDGDEWKPSPSNDAEQSGEVYRMVLPGGDHLEIGRSFEGHIGKNDLDEYHKHPWGAWYNGGNSIGRYATFEEAKSKLFKYAASTISARIHLLKSDIELLNATCPRLDDRGEK